MGTRNRAPQTLQARFGFQDADLKTPMHDEMMLWLTDRLDMLGEKITGCPKEAAWDPSYLESRVDQAQGRLDRWRDALDERQREHGQKLLAGLPERISDLPVPESCTFEWGDVIWEKPIISNGKYTIGFVDLATTLYWSPELHMCGLNDLPTGYFIDPDQIVELSWQARYSKNLSFYFECKSAIPSLGEVVRQIRFYQTYLRGHYVVVCPDARWEQPLLSQGIDFIHYPHL